MFINYPLLLKLYKRNKKFFKYVNYFDSYREIIFLQKKALKSTTIFLIILSISLIFFSWTSYRFIRRFRVLQKAYKINKLGKRFIRTLVNGFLQERILRRPLVGFMHILVFFGFLITLFSSIEMIIDGLTGQHQSLAILGMYYDIIAALLDIFAYIVILVIFAFIFRRTFLKVKRFQGKEIRLSNKIDALVCLSLILLLMITLAGMNIMHSSLYIDSMGWYPISQQFVSLTTDFSYGSRLIMYEIFWWSHIIIIFIFANFLPYSKHFHVFLSIPNVLLSKIEPLGKIQLMDNVLIEVRKMIDPTDQISDFSDDSIRFGVVDVEDASWKTYLDALSCTECGRCTDVCPANNTGKPLSPRKIIMDFRKRASQRLDAVIKNGNQYSDGKTLIRDYVTEEEIWSCTMCLACARECPVNIDHPSLILDLRRYLVLEKAAAPPTFNAFFINIENNGSPWKYSPEDRLLWLK